MRSPSSGAPASESYTLRLTRSGGASSTSRCSDERPVGRSSMSMTDMPTCAASDVMSASVASCSSALCVTDGSSCSR
eukprot:1522658-Prymnesium_polylepis.1